MEGLYQNPKRGKQLLRFDGFGLDKKSLESVMATDIDALIDVRDKILIVVEAKLAGKEVPRGQQYALQRIVTDAKKAGKHAIAIVADHDVYDPEQDVFLKDLICREVFESEQEQWRRMKRRMTVRELANWYVNRYFDA